MFCNDFQASSQDTKSISPNKNPDTNQVSILSDFYILKVDSIHFKVETFEFDDITSEIVPLKTPNKLDVLFYDDFTKLTAIFYDFYDVSTPLNEWLPVDVLPDSPTGIYWAFSNNYKSFYLIQNGKYLDISKYRLKKSTTDSNQFIIEENGIDTYLMKDLKGKKLDSFYPLFPLK